MTVHEDFGFGVRENGQLRSVASLLIRRPDLAGLVRQFTLHVERPRGEVESQTKDPKSLNTSKNSRILKSSDTPKNSKNLYALNLSGLIRL